MRALQHTWSGQAETAFHGATDPHPDAALRAGAELLRRWAGARGSELLVTLDPTLEPYRSWLAAPPSNDPIQGDPRALADLAAARAAARRLQARPESEPTDLAAAVLMVKAAAVRAAGGAAQLVAHVCQREGLGVLPRLKSVLDTPRPQTPATETVPPPTSEDLAALAPQVRNWSGFSTAMAGVVTLDLEPRLGKRRTSACLPLDAGRSVVLASFDGSHDASASVLHEVAHAFTYWTLASTPELLRPPRAIDEQVALDIELRLHLAWAERLDPHSRIGFVAAVEHRWWLLLNDTMCRLERELHVLKLLDTGDTEAAIELLLDQVPLAELRGNPQLVDEELAPARYATGATRALADWSTSTPFDQHVRLGAAPATPAPVEAVSDQWRRYMSVLRL
ncbi:hypothetical protein [Polymorphospora rubra]|nr:hypothetical protein [Polymorphospora rubra]